MAETPVKPCLKICGNTNIEDVRLVGASGAEYCGILVNVAFSERSLSLQRAAELASESKIPTVILVCDPRIEEVEEVVVEIKPFAVQLLGHEPPELVRELKSGLQCRVWKTIHLPLVSGQASPEKYARAGADALLVDSVDTSEGFQRLGGTGKVADWKAAAAIIKAVTIPVFLAGGINPGNVEKAITEVRPYGIDLCSGVEGSRGKKDPEKLRNLVKNFRSAIEKLS
ncbi:MAG: phosphoribosylanthranilate isomerase [Deltaproteobacteria bacterium]|nr:phosphoribosylanthranilate isomerase [Deltaproteobacteria bacterium]